MLHAGLGCDILRALEIRCPSHTTTATRRTIIIVVMQISRQTKSQHSTASHYRRLLLLVYGDISLAAVVCLFVCLFVGFGGNDWKSQSKINVFCCAAHTNLINRRGRKEQVKNIKIKYNTESYRKKKKNKFRVRRVNNSNNNEMEMFE